MRPTTYGLDSLISGSALDIEEPAAFLSVAFPLARASLLSTRRGTHPMAPRPFAAAMHTCERMRRWAHAPIAGSIRVGAPMMIGWWAASTIARLERRDGRDTTMV